MISRKCPRKITISRIMRRLMSNYERIKDHKMSHKTLLFTKKLLDHVIKSSWSLFCKKLALPFSMKKIWNRIFWWKIFDFGNFFCKKFSTRDFFRWKNFDFDENTYKYSSRFVQEGIRVRKEMGLCPGREPCTFFLVQVCYNRSTSFLVMYHNF